MKIQCDCQGWKDRYGNLNYCSDCGKSLYVKEAELSASDNTAMFQLLSDLKPMLYGICIREYGHPDKWPKRRDRQCIVLYDRINAVLAQLKQ